MMAASLSKRRGNPVPQEKKLVIEIQHPVDELKTLSDALKALSQPGLSKAEIQRQRKVIKAAKAYQRLFHAYVKYQKFRVAFLEQKLAEIERS
jgi:hypothetical protein